MRILYNILFTIFFILSAPYYFLRMRRRPNWKPGFWQRFARYDAKLKQALTNRHTLWLHAVSVGEVNVCTQLIRALEPRLPNLKFVVSTTTSTGMGELQRKLPHNVSKIYYPVDFKGCVDRALRSIHPEAVVLVEAEIWPNFIWRAQDLGIPLFLVNARVSRRSFRGYKRLGFLFRPLFGAFKGVGAQNADDVERLRQLGYRPEAVQLMGNLKFDAAAGPAQKNGLDAAAILRQLGVPPDARVLVAGSTHDGEEALLAAQLLRLKESFPDLFLVLVPRHAERTNEVSRQLKAAGVRFALRSEVGTNADLVPGTFDCLLVNTTGELVYFYEQATVVFVGKSITAEGGQNPIEPAQLGKPVVFGPNMQNFVDVVRLFLAQDAVVQVRNAAELESALAEILANPARQQQLGASALKVVQENRGAVERTVDMLVKHFEGGPIYVAAK